MTTADTIYELVKDLPEDQANLVLVFAEFVRQRAQTTQPANQPTFTDCFGILKDSPSFNEDPVMLQRTMRREWD